MSPQSAALIDHKMGPHPITPIADMSVGEQIRAFRNEVGLSQMDVAVLCRVDASTVYRWERNEHQHVHKSKDRNIRLALEALKWAVAAQRDEPDRVITLYDVQMYLRDKERQRRRGGRPTGVV